MLMHCYLTCVNCAQNIQHAEHAGAFKLRIKHNQPLTFLFSCTIRQRAQNCRQETCT